MDAAIKLLLVEDNAGDVKLLEEALACAPSFQCELSRVNCLAKGIEFLKTLPVDLLLLDLDLPDSTGLDTVVRAIEAAPQVAIVVLTGFEDDEIGVEAVRRGAQDYLLKREASGSLVTRAIRYALERKRLLRELQDAAAQINTLRGMLPICSTCKRIRDEKGQWHKLEAYISEHAPVDFSHGTCPECMRTLYPECDEGEQTST